MTKAERISRILNAASVLLEEAPNMGDAGREIEDSISDFRQKFWIPKTPVPAVLFGQSDDLMEIMSVDRKKNYEEMGAYNGRVFYAMVLGLNDPFLCPPILCSFHLKWCDEASEGTSAWSWEPLEVPEGVRYEIAEEPYGQHDPDDTTSVLTIQNPIVWVVEDLFDDE